MDDLIERATKYARGAGRTGLGHYDAAHRTSSRARLLTGTNVVLSAGVGTAVFSQLVSDWPIVTGIVALTAAALGALQANSDFADRSARHRVAGARYGALRRRADMLSLKLRAGDIQRDQALAELDVIGTELSKLAEESLALPDGIYYPAKAKFDRDHIEYHPHRADTEGSSHE